MRIQINTVSNPGAPATERQLEASSLHIGRGTDQDLVLGDLRIALAHAEINGRKGLMGPVYRIEAKSRLGVWVNGRPCTSAELNTGDVVDLGRYQLTVVPAAAGCELTLLLEERYAAHDERDNRRQALKLTLRDAGWSRRRWAWGLFLLILLPGLLLPLSLSQKQAESRAEGGINRQHQPQQQPGLDIVWNSGPLSSAHQVLQNDCLACHRKPFERAKDDGCRSCHADLGEHAASLRVMQQAPFSTQQCTDCHREHNGLTGLTPQNNATCTDCHAQPQQLPGKKLLAVSDFTKSHPPFSLGLARASAKGFVWTELAQDLPQARRQDTGLKFPHDVHLASKGIAAPGGVKQMVCGDCHQANADRSGFLPVTMARHCADCHRLDFDASAPERELPHGRPEEAARIVRDYYAGLALSGRVPAAVVAEGGSLRQRPGEPVLPALPASGRTQAWATAKAEVALRDVFERRTCFYCHSVSKDGPADTPWRIAPVAEQKTALSGSLFPHSAHATEKCGSCHEATKSKHSEDVLLPGITRCRDCHGDTGAMTETPSPCQSCHGYHSHDLKALDRPPTSAAPAATGKLSP